MNQPEELSYSAQNILIELSNALDDTYQERVAKAIAISRVQVCSIRIHPLNSDNETFHVVSECYGLINKNLASTIEQLGYTIQYESIISPVSVQKIIDPADLSDKKMKYVKMPLFTSSYEVQASDQLFLVSLGFSLPNSLIVKQPRGCFQCGEEEFCSKLENEVYEEGQGILWGVIPEIAELFTSFWSPVLADFAASFGVKYLYDSVPYLLDQLYDSWEELPGELEPTYMEHILQYDGKLVKNSDLCLNEECGEPADYGRFCFMHSLD